MAWLSHALKVARVIKQLAVALVRLNVVDNRCFQPFALAMRALAKRKLAKLPSPKPFPLPGLVKPGVITAHLDRAWNAKQWQRARYDYDRSDKQHQNPSDLSEPVGHWDKAEQEVDQVNDDSDDNDEDDKAYERVDHLRCSELLAHFCPLKRKTPDAVSRSGAILDYRSNLSQFAAEMSSFNLARASAICFTTLPRTDMIAESLVSRPISGRTER